MKTWRHTLAIAGLLCLTLTAGCGNLADSDNDSSGENDPYAAYTTSRATMTENGEYYVEYSPSTSPIPLQEIFQLTVDIYDSSDKQQVVPASGLSISARMPTHGHGMNTDPVVENQGDGRFMVDGMKFHMPSNPDNPWVLEITVEAGPATDVANFRVHTSSN